ncbi:MAG: hypothetical protein HOB37_05810 [Rhodospirillaceae bacterium]|jgi:hypothetical protein|nr:hypothetical protein [Rhodospirillaceae bacterium]
MGGGEGLLIIGGIILVFVFWQMSKQAKVKAFEDALSQIIERERPRWESGYEDAVNDKKHHILNTLSEALARSPFEFFTNFYELIPWSDGYQYDIYRCSVPARTAVPFASGYRLPSEWRLEDGELVYEKGFRVGINGFSPSLEKRFKQRFLLSLAEISSESSIYNVFLDAGFRRRDFKNDRGTRYYTRGPVGWLVEDTNFSKSTFGRLSSKREATDAETKQKNVRQIDLTPRKYTKDEQKDKADVTVGSLNEDVGGARKELPTQPFVRKNPVVSQAAPAKESWDYTYSTRNSSPTTNVGSKRIKHHRLNEDSKNNNEKNLSSETSIYVLLTPFQTDCPEGFLDIKVGESTNVENRVKDYISYWQDRFKVVCLLHTETVSKETDIHKSLQKWSVSGECYQIPIALYQAIVKAGTADGMVKVIMEYD